MTTPNIVLTPPQLIVDRCAANHYYRAAVETDELVEAIELRARALRTRAELPPVPVVPMPAKDGAELDAWLETATQAVELERNRTVRDETLSRLIGSLDMRIAGITSNVDPALARLNDSMNSVMSIAAKLVSRLMGCHTAAAIVANGDPDPLAAYQDLRRLRANEYDAIRTAQTWVMTASTRRVINFHSDWLIDDDLADDAQIGDLDRLFPSWKRQRGADSITAITDQPQPDPRPWPKDKTEQLIWMVSSGAKVWVPTFAQLGALGRQRMEEIRHSGGAPSRRPVRRPNQRPQRTLGNKSKGNGTSQLLTTEVPA